MTRWVLNNGVDSLKNSIQNQMFFFFNICNCFYKQKLYSVHLLPYGNDEHKYFSWLLLADRILPKCQILTKRQKLQFRPKFLIQDDGKNCENFKIGISSHHQIHLFCRYGEVRRFLKICDRYNSNVISKKGKSCIEDEDPLGRSDFVPTP